jgi:hypothetical protein
LKVFLFIL